MATQVKRKEHLLSAGTGMARIDLAYVARSRALVALGHGAGGDSHAPVLLAVRDALLAAGVATALVDQPYRVAGRRAPDRAERLDTAMSEVVRWLRAELPGVPLFVGGKSSGARVGARISRELGAAGVVALGFPLIPPGRPERSRAAELAAGCPVLVLQGSRDSFGTPAAVREAARGLPVEVHEVSGGDHSFNARRADNRTTAECVREVAGVVAAWVAGATS